MVVRVHRELTAGTGRVRALPVPGEAARREGPLPDADAIIGNHKPETGDMALLPREGKFFDFFNAHAEHAVRAALELQALLADLTQLERRSRAIEKNEKQA